MTIASEWTISIVNVSRPNTFQRDTVCAEYYRHIHIVRVLCIMDELIRVQFNDNDTHYRLTEHSWRGSARYRVFTTSLNA